MEIFIAYHTFRSKIHLFGKVTDKRPLCKMSEFVSIETEADAKEFLSQPDGTNGNKHQVCKKCRKKAEEMLKESELKSKSKLK